jgi:hypothetical protein
VPRIGDNFVDLTKLDSHTLCKMPGEVFRYTLEQLLKLDAQDRRELQLLRYRPPNVRTRNIFKSKARLIGIGGGNGSGKTTTALVKVIAMATGVIPDVLREDLRPQFPGECAGDRAVADDGVGPDHFAEIDVVEVDGG